jgi:hypothetical protein
MNKLLDRYQERICCKQAFNWSYYTHT